MSQADNQSVYIDVGTEKAVIGAAMIDAEAAKTVSQLSPDLFADQKHIAAHAAIRALVAAGVNEMDYVTVEAKARENGSSLDALYLVECTEFCPTSRNLPRYVSILTQCAMRRKLNATARELLDKAGDPTAEPDETREWCVRQMKEIRSADSDRLIPMSDAIMSTVHKLQDEQKGVADNKRIRTGIYALDNILGGFRDSEMVVVGARPSVGKSILALTFCVNAALEGKRVLLISLEMNETEITERVLANIANVPLGSMTNAKITEEQWASVGGSVGKISRLPLWYCLEATTVERVRKAAYKLYEDGGLDMIAVDYLQLMEATFAKKQNRQEQISEISRGLRKLSMDLGIPVIVLSQLNRSSEGYSRDGKGARREPTMSEARESGSIEQDANIFILLHNPRRDEMATEDEARIWDNLKSSGLTPMRVIVDKNRQGKRGRLLVAFDGDHMRFHSIDFNH